MNSKISEETLTWTEGNVKGFQSKSLIDLNNGTVKLVRVDPQSSYPLHRHPDKTEYAYVISGNLQFTIGDGTYDGVPGDFFIFKIRTTHAISNLTDKSGIILIGAIKEGD